MQVKLTSVESSVKTPTSEARISSSSIVDMPSLAISASGLRSCAISITRYVARLVACTVGQSTWSVKVRRQLVRFILPAVVTTVAKAT